MDLSKNALTVLERRYLKKDIEGNVIETPREMLERVAKHIAKADEIYGEDAGRSEKEFFDMMDSLKFMPNSPTLMNAGRPLGQLSACFVLPIEDSMDGIFTTLKNAALIHKSGGGTGFSFSRIRAAGTSVDSTGGVASGPVSFMKVYNAATEAVKQGGTRRGANMGILRIDHPDILEFIKCKEDLTQMTNFNISVGITEEFMEAAKRGDSYSLYHPETGKKHGELDAYEVFELITDMAHKNGEPGIVFLDRINRDNPIPKAGDIESTNPCGEQPLLPYESCNLGSINLSKFVKTGSEPSIDYEELGKTIETAVHFLDNVIDANNYPLGKIEETTKASRKVGLGVMGFADLLMMMGIGYNTDEGVALGRDLMRFIQKRAKKASQMLGEKRGSFPLYDESVFAKSGKPMRNSTVTTIAPTGTISIICGASSGIEPVFAMSYIRNVMDSDHLIEVHPFFEKTARKKGYYSKELMEEIAEKGSLHDIDGIPEEDKNIFVCAHDVSPLYHISMQSAFQADTDNAVSKTVNFDRTATAEDVRKVYELAYSSGCKGVTIYRDGSRDSQVLNIGKVNEKEKHEEKKEPAPELLKEAVKEIAKKAETEYGNLNITVSFDENGVSDVATTPGLKYGSPLQFEATGNFLSSKLPSGVSVAIMIEQLRGLKFGAMDLKKRVLADIKMSEEQLPEYSGAGGTKGRSGGELSRKMMIPPSTCPDCDGELEHEGGCTICRGCGYSRCG